MAIPNNQQVFVKSIELISEFLINKGFEDIASQLKQATAKHTVPNPTDEYYPNVIDISQLERLLATTVLSECVHQTLAEAAQGDSKNQVALAPATPSGRRRGAAWNFVKFREVDDTWDTDDDLGYVMIPTKESELNAYAASEYEATTLGHESYERYSHIEWDEELLAAVEKKIEALKTEFPGELNKLLASLGLDPEEYIDANEEQINRILLNHFKQQIEAEYGPVIPAPPAPKQLVEEYQFFYLKVIQIKNKTGFEETKDFPIIMGDIIAGRYQVQEYLGSAAFSRAIQCYDLVSNRPVCMKIITNNKDFFDQSLDEIKLLTLIKAHGDLDANNLLEIYDYFYFKEHLFLVTELLRDNLYEFYKYNHESGDELYFTMDRLKRVARQILVALEYMHKLNLIHSDLKPENIVIKSYSKCQVKVIDLGSSCFITDHLSSYVQSRSYRAPEVILGLPYGRKIDIWSLGCILAELYTGNVLFLNDTLATLLARVDAIIGPIPEHMKQGYYYWRYYTLDDQIYDRRPEGPVVIKTKPTSLAHRLKTKDPLFLDFMTRLLSIDPNERPTSAEALCHPWLAGVE